MADKESPKFKVTLTEVVLKAPKVGISSGVLRAHTEALKATPAIYPFTCTEVKTFTVAKGQ